MKKLLFGIFAHPDDESFGPSGTLIQEVSAGTDLRLVCITRGDAGRNPDGHESIGDIRMQEWQRACNVIGATDAQQFGYGDGTLCNSLFHEVAGRLQLYVETIVEMYSQPAEINFMTFDPSGVTGHLDHVAVSHITTFTFLRLQTVHPKWRFGHLRYFCLPYNKAIAHNISFVYMPPGKQQKEVDEKRDVSEVYDKKLAAMRAHASQRQDMKWMLEVRGEAVKTEEFFYFED